MRKRASLKLLKACAKKFARLLLEISWLDSGEVTEILQTFKTFCLLFRIKKGQYGAWAEEPYRHRLATWLKSHNWTWISFPASWPKQLGKSITIKNTPIVRSTCKPRCWQHPNTAGRHQCDISACTHARLPLHSAVVCRKPGKMNM